MFTFVSEPTAWIDVEWKDLDEEGFQRTNTIRAHVLFVPQSEISPEATEQVQDFIRRVLRDWSQIRGPDNKPWPFTAENLGAMLERAPGFQSGFILSYLKARAGIGKEREKNSSASPAAGPAGEGRKPKPRASKSS